MTIHSPPRKVSETENMLRLLLCVDTLDSATATQLWTFAAEQELMDYVSMRLCLHKLIAAGELETGGGALDEQLFLTDRGREALALFGSRLPGDVCRRIAQAAPEFRGRMTRTQQVRAAYETARPNEYRLNLAVYQGELPAVHLDMETRNRSLAARTIHRFPLRAARVTTYLYSLAQEALSQPEQEGQAALAPEAVVEHSSAEYTTKATVACRRANFTVQLLLPSRPAAEALVRYLAEQDRAATVATTLTELVSGARRIGSRKKKTTA